MRSLALVALLGACSDDPTAETPDDDPVAPSPVLTPPEVVQAVFAAVFAGDTDAIETLVREDYIQHSALAEDGRQGLLDAMPTLATLDVEVHRQLVDRDLVALHSTYGFPDGTEQVAFDVFRVQDGQLAEHWDAFQSLVPADETVSGNSMTGGPVPGEGDTEANREHVVEFVDRVLTQGEFDLLTDYVSAESYTQRNPLVGDGVAGIGAFVADITAQGLVFFYTDSPLVVAQGDFVLVGSEGVFGPAEEQPYAIFYDMFRVEGGLIVEHWDVIPPSPDPATLPHDNGFF